MNKLSKRILERCDLSNCCLNEFMALPEEGDIGFEEYFDYKLDLIVKAKMIFSPIEQNSLMLAYPKPDSKELNIFDRFFESPAIVAKNHDFEGLFGIDISSYINKTDEYHFSELMTYIHQNPQTTFLIFAYTNNTNEIAKLYSAISQYIEISQSSIPLPTPRELTDYTISNVRDFSLHVSKTVTDYLMEFYSKKAFGYDTADYLIKRLKDGGYKGDLTTIKEMVADIDKSLRISGSPLGYGY